MKHFIKVAGIILSATFILTACGSSSANKAVPNAVCETAGTDVITASDTTVTVETTTTMIRETLPETTATEETTTVATTTVAETTTTAAPKCIVPEEYRELADEIFDKTNEYRIANGVSELKYNIYLQNAAQTRANECIKSFSHTRPDGREYNTVLSDYNIKSWFRDFGENQAAWSAGNTHDSASAEYIVGTKWMQSKEGHRENMLKANYTHVGIGVSKSSSGWYYFVQLFAETKKGVTI